MSAYSAALLPLLTYIRPTPQGAETHTLALTATELLGNQLRFIITDVAIAGGLAIRQDFEAITKAVESHGATIGGMFGRAIERDDTINDAVNALNTVRMCATRAIGATTVTGSQEDWLIRMGDALAALEIANARAIAHWDQQGLIGHESPG